MTRRSPGDRARRAELHDLPAADAPAERDHLRVAGSGPERDHLDALKKVIETEYPELRGRIVQGGRFARPHLRVWNSKVASLSEIVGCEVRDGEYWFTWSWNDTIGPADDPQGSANALHRVVTPEV